MQTASSDSTLDTEAAAAKMLGSIGRYVEGEAELSLESYRLLQSMNIATADRYGAIADYSAGLVAFAQRLQAKTDSTTPQLAQVKSRQSPAPPVLLHAHTQVAHARALVSVRARARPRACAPFVAKWF